MQKTPIKAWAKSVSDIDLYSKDCRKIFRWKNTQPSKISVNRGDCPYFPQTISLQKNFYVEYSYLAVIKVLAIPRTFHKKSQHCILNHFWVNSEFRRPFSMEGRPSAQNRLTVHTRGSLPQGWLAMHGSLPQEWQDVWKFFKY